MTDIKTMIKNLIGIEVQTDDLAELRLDPAKHTATQEDAAQTLGIDVSTLWRKRKKYEAE